MHICIAIYIQLAIASSQCVFSVLTKTEFSYSLITCITLLVIQKRMKLKKRNHVFQQHNSIINTMFIYVATSLQIQKLLSECRLIPASWSVSLHLKLLPYSISSLQGFPRANPMHTLLQQEHVMHTECALHGFPIATPRATLCTRLVQPPKLFDFCLFLQLPVPLILVLSGSAPNVSRIREEKMLNLWSIIYSYVWLISAA